VINRHPGVALSRVRPQKSITGAIVVAEVCWRMPQMMMLPSEELLALCREKCPPSRSAMLRFVERLELTPGESWPPCVHSVTGGSPRGLAIAKKLARTAFASSPWRA